MSETIWSVGVPIMHTCSFSHLWPVRLASLGSSCFVRSPAFFCNDLVQGLRGSCPYPLARVRVATTDPTRPAFPFSHPAEAATRAHHLHALSAGRARGALRQDSLPRHLHARGGGAQDQPARVQSTGALARGFQGPGRGAGPGWEVVWSEGGLTGWAAPLRLPLALGPGLAEGPKLNVLP